MPSGVVLESLDSAGVVMEAMVLPAPVMVEVIERGPRGMIGPSGAGLDITGPWDVATLYVRGDVVSNAGSSWMALRENEGVVPVEGADWTLLAAKGEPGDPGGATAADISYAPTGNVGATDVQGAISELDTEKVSKAGGSIIQTSGPAVVGLITRSSVGQTGDLHKWQNSGGGDLAKVDALGIITAAGLSLGSGSRRKLDVSSGQAIIGGTSSVGGTIAALTVVPNSASEPGLLIRQAASQSGDPFAIKDSTDTVLTRFLSTGGLIIGSATVPSARITASAATQVSQGYVAAFNGQSAAQAILRVRAAASQTGNIAEFTDSSGAILSRVDSAGEFWVGGTKLTAITGASSPLSLIANSSTERPLLLKAAASQSANLFETQNSAGSVNSTIDGSGFASFNVNNSGGTALTVKRTTLMDVGAASTIGLIVRARASQTADLQQWQDSATAALLRITAGGQLHNAGSTNYLNLPGGEVVITSPLSTSTVPLLIRALASHTGNLAEFQSSASAVLMRIRAGGTAEFNYGLYTQGPVNNTPSSGHLLIDNRATNGSTDSKGLVIIGRTSQSANMIEVLNSSSTVLARISSIGALHLEQAGLAIGTTTGSVTGPRISLTNTSAAATIADGGSIWVESGALKYKGSSGTVTQLAAA